MLRSLLAIAVSAAALLAQRPIALVGATVHPGDGSSPIPDAVVVVTGERITAVGPAATTAVPEGAERIDLKGQHVVPGLIDTHVHYSQTGWVDGRPDAADLRQDYPYEKAMADNREHPERFHRAFVHAGVTAVFDVGGYPWTLLLAQATEHDPLAPHVVAAGPLLATYDPHLSLPDARQFDFPKTPDEARAMVREHKAAGAAAMKFWFIARDGDEVHRWKPVLDATGDECKQVGLPLIVHATTLDTARAAVAAGATLLVHSVEDRDVDAEFVAAIVKAGTAYCPTLTVRSGYAMVYAAKIGDEVQAQLDDVDPTVKARVTATEKLTPRDNRLLAAMQKRLALQGDTMAKNLHTLHAAGVPIVMGTDAGNPLTLHGPSVFVEMEAMVRAGMTPKDVLVSATGAAAKALGRGNDLGRVAAGCAADLVVLPDDPEHDIAALRRSTRIMRAGVLRARADTLPR